MANLKLTSDYWETSGVYDLTQKKTQRGINSDVITKIGSTTMGTTATTLTGAIKELNDKATSLQGQISAYVETTNTATKKTYVAGDYMVWNGALYRVKSTITNGGTISSDKLYAVTATTEIKSANDSISSLSTAFKRVKPVTEVSDFGTESFFFSANAEITLSPSSQKIPIYSKGIFVTTGNDAIIIAITSAGEEIIAFRNGSNWIYPTNISAVLSTLTSKVGRVDGTNSVSTEAQLIGRSQFFDTTADIPLGSTGITLEAYARGVVLANGNTGAIIACGYNGRVYAAFFANGSIVNAQLYRTDSPTFTGTPTAPTAATGTNTQQIATTAFVQNTFSLEQDVTLTPESGIEILANTSKKYGKILFLKFRFKCTAQVGIYNKIATHGFGAAVQWAAPLLTTSYTQFEQRYGVYADYGNTTVRAATAIPAGTYDVYAVILIS